LIGAYSVLQAKEFSAVHIAHLSMDPEPPH